MPNERSNGNGQSAVTDQQTVDTITERRKRLANLIGRLLARTWLQRRRQTEKGKPSSSDSQDDRGA